MAEFYSDSCFLSDLLWKVEETPTVTLKLGGGEYLSLRDLTYYCLSKHTFVFCFCKLPHCDHTDTVWALLDFSVPLMWIGGFHGNISKRRRPSVWIRRHTWTPLSRHDEESLRFTVESSRTRGVKHFLLCDDKPNKPNKDTANQGIFKLTFCGVLNHIWQWSSHLKHWGVFKQTVTGEGRPFYSAISDSDFQIVY